MSFTPQHEAALRQAVRQLNDTLATIHKDCGGTVTIRPWANYNDSYASIHVEVTTGRVYIDDGSDQ